MGMRANFAAIAPARLEALRADPAATGVFFNAETGEGGPVHRLDIDKAWHGLHFLLTGQAWGGEGPLAQAVLGGQELEGDEDEESPLRCLTAAEVSAVSAALDALPLDELSRRYDPAALEAADIYPPIWVRDGQDAFDYLAHWHAELVRFYRHTAARGDALLLQLS